ncbi:MAG: hypothetical protein AUK03_09645 [Anaerolineae bacterium CG2_30_64_16]|nr:MAG: hypothetical protein AUK03_09645 [Anaerolineae bacterium CG2_30_64_16]
MLSVKEALRNTIDLLTEEEAYRIWEFAQHVYERPHVSRTMRRLASDPAFRVPASGIGPFHPVEPIKGKGIPASRLLVEDRR